MDPNEKYKVGNVSGEYPLLYPSCCSRAVGGTGGADGIGFESGGKGGTGKGPVIISAGRKRRYSLTNYRWVAWEGFDIVINWLPIAMGLHYFSTFSYGDNISGRVRSRCRP
jgi:hypothetical protein